MKLRSCRFLPLRRADAFKLSIMVDNWNWTGSDGATHLVGYMDAYSACFCFFFEDVLKQPLSRLFASL